MLTKEILDSHPLKVLKSEISKQNIKGYSKMKRSELTALMLKHKDKFMHIKHAGKKEKKAKAPAKPKGTHKMQDGSEMTGKVHSKDSKPVEKKKVRISSKAVKKSKAKGKAKAKEEPKTDQINKVFLDYEKSQEWLDTKITEESIESAFKNKTKEQIQKAVAKFQDLLNKEQKQTIKVQSKLNGLINENTDPKLLKKIGKSKRQYEKRIKDTISYLTQEFRDAMRKAKK